MSWTTRAGRFLSFMWRSGTTGVQDFDENAAQRAVESAIDNIKGSYPELAFAQKAIVRSRPHPTPKADGRIDPLHVNFQITDANDQPITSAHAYPAPLGGRYVWFSKPKYNNDQEAKQYFPEESQRKDNCQEDGQGDGGAGQRLIGTK